MTDASRFGGGAAEERLPGIGDPEELGLLCRTGGGDGGGHVVGNGGGGPGGGPSGSNESGGYGGGGGGQVVGNGGGGEAAEEEEAGWWCPRREDPAWVAAVADRVAAFNHVDTVTPSDRLQASLLREWLPTFELS